MKITRFLQITHAFLYFRLYQLIPDGLVPWYIKIFKPIVWLYPKVPAKQSNAKNLRIALENLGPVWIKFGQMLSTRKDLLSAELSLELSKLQDQVPPFSAEIAAQQIKSSLELQSLDELFEEFDMTPLASASIAQVHAAKLITPHRVTNDKAEGHIVADDKPATIDVVVKVIRPGIEKQIHADVSLMAWFAALLENTLAEAKRLRPAEVVDEYKKTILSELNLVQEAANGIQLKRNFADSSDLYIPEIYSEYCRQNVLVMERIYGIPVSDIDQITAQGSDLKKLAERGVRVFFTQVFRDSFFHADMHPGNIFISKEVDINDLNLRDKYIGIDVGIIGTLNSGDKRYLAENFVAFFNRDYLKVAELHVQSGWVPSHVNVEQFEMAIRTVCEPIFNKPLEDISFAQVLIGLFDTARQFEMQVQPQLVLLQKTLLYVEGLGRQLYPKLDLWETAKPFLENWVNEQMGVKALFESTKKNLPYWLEKTPQVPDLVFNSLQNFSQLPTMKNELVTQYQDLQYKQQQFFKRLAVFSISSIAVLLISLFADVPNNTNWLTADFVLAAVALYSGWKLRK